MPKEETLKNPDDNAGETPEQKKMSEALQQMAENLESTSDLPQNFNEVFDNLKMQKDMRMGSYQTTVNELMSMADGEDADGIRQEYYPKWKDGDFKELLKKLGE